MLSITEADQLSQPESFDHLHLVTESFNMLRRYTPEFLNVLQLNAAPAAHCFADHAEAGTTGIRTGLSITRDAHNDQLGKFFEQLFGIKAPFLQRAGPETLDEYRSRRQQLQQEFLRLGLAQVEAQALLVAPVDLPVGRNALGLPGAQRVPGGRLDLEQYGMSANLGPGTALTIETRVENKSDVPMPFSLGFHPYFAIADAAKAIAHDVARLGGYAGCIGRPGI